MPSSRPAPIAIADLVNSHEWVEMIKSGKFKIPTQAELDALCLSGLQLEKPDGNTLFQRLSPLEFYSADLLYKLWHLRYTGLPGDRPSFGSAPVFHWIEPSATRFVDPDKLLFAIPPGDNIWQQRVDQVLSETPDVMKKLLNLVEAVACLGSPDSNREDQESIDGQVGDMMSHQQHRVDIGCIGQDFKGEDGVDRPAKVTGKKFLNTVETDCRWAGSGIKDLVGDLCLLTWVLMDDLEREINGVPLAPDLERNKEFAAHLREHLGIFEQQFNAESVTIVVGILYPNLKHCSRHQDKKNDRIPGYTKTGRSASVMPAKVLNKRHTPMRIVR